MTGSNANEQETFLGFPIKKYIAVSLLFGQVGLSVRCAGTDVANAINTQGANVVDAINQNTQAVKARTHLSNLCPKP